MVQDRSRTVTEMSNTRRLIGVDAIAAVDGILGFLLSVVGSLVIVTSLARTFTAADPLFDVQLPLLVGASLVALGVVVVLVAWDLQRREETGRVASAWLAGIALVTFYLQLHVGAILLSGAPFGNDPVVLGVGAVAALVYAVPKLVYLTRDDVVARTRGIVPVGTAGEADEEAPVDAGEPLHGEPVEGGRALQSDLVQGRRLDGGVPDGAVARTTCSACATELAVTTPERPVLVECPDCGTHGRLGTRDAFETAR